MIKLNRLIQAPLTDFEYSKNIIDITIEADTYAEASSILDKALADQMGKFNTGLEEIQEYGKMVRVTQLFTKLLNGPLGPQIQTEIARIKAQG